MDAGQGARSRIDLPDTWTRDSMLAGIQNALEPTAHGHG
jgi:hypothetical protein